MNKFFSLIFVLFLLSGSLCAKVKQLVILHSNDTHSAIMPLNCNLADTLLAGRAGYLRRINLLKEQRAITPDLLLFDSGDFSQGSPFYTMYKGDVEVGLMNQMRYDAATIGNHEFDFGLENMARLFKKANFPIVCANYDFTGTPVEGIVKPYVILKRGRLKIGVFGLSPKTEGLVDINKCVGVKYLDPVKVGNEIAAYLKEKCKCDLVVCLSHLGWDTGDDDDQYLMKNTRNIDVVLGGHSHTYMREMRYVKNIDGKNVPNDQNGKHGIFIGKLVLQMSNR